MKQTELFERAPKLPSGFRYLPELISRAEEQRLLDDLQWLEFKPFEFHGFLGKRRIVSFGWRYDFNGGGLQKTDDIPPFLHAIRSKAGVFAQLKACELQQVLLTEYRPGTTIGGIKTEPCSATSWAFPSCRRAPSAYAKKQLPAGSVTRWSWSRDRLIFSTAKCAANGSTAFRR